MNTLRARFLLVALAAGMSVAAVTAHEATLASRLQAAERLYRTAGPAEALPQFEVLLEEASESGDEASRAIALRFVGECHWRMGEFEQSRRYLARALESGSAQGDALTGAKALNVLGLLEWDSGNYDAALARFSEANARAERLGDARLQGAILNNTSLVFDELGDYPASLEGYRRVLELYGQVDFPRGEGDTLGNIGGVHLLLGHFNEAIDYYQRALAISESLDSIAAMSQDHGNLGFAYDGLGQVDRSIEQFDRALELAQSAGLAQEQAYWLRGKANAEIRAGLYDLGLQHHRQALGIYRGLGDNAPLLDALHDMGRLYLELGDPISSQSHFEQALALAEVMSRSRSITLNQLALGDMKLRQRQFAEALSLYEAALERADAAGETDLLAAAWLSQSRLQLEQHKFGEALKAARRAQVVIKSFPQQPVAVAAALLEGIAMLEQGQASQALAVFGKALEIAGKIGDPDLLWQLEYGRGLALELEGDKSGAAAALGRAVSEIESVRVRLREKRFRTGYLQDKRQVYTDLVRLQLELGREDKAFDTAEQLRSFSFSEQVQPAFSQQAKGELAQMHSRIRQLQRVIDEERAWPPAEQRQRALQTYSSELLAAEQQYQALLDDLATASQVRPEGLATTEVRARLKKGEALLSYVVGQDDVMLFVLTPAEMHTSVVPVRRASLRSRIELLRDLLQQTANDRWAAPATSLAASLLEPAMANGWLEGVKRLYLVPHGELHYLPFAVLTVEVAGQSTVLIEQFDLAYLPSASALYPKSGAGNPQRSVLSVAPARSRLRYAAEEAQAVADMFGNRSKSLQGSAATETAFRDLAGQYGVIHLATHGYFNHLNPILSGLELELDDQHDGLLEVHEILELQLNAQLVTLSACETGLGSGYFDEIPAGDEFVGLTRAFLQAGSTSVLATLWEVDDLSTLGLMKDFYTQLEKASSNNEEVVALARAQRSLRLSNDHQHPYYWAPFMLLSAGDPGANTKS